MPNTLELPDSVQIVNPHPVDYYYGPWATVSAAKAGVPSGVRYQGMTVFVTATNSKYCWLTGTTDSDLVPDLENLDSTPTEGSLNGVESGGVYDALQVLLTDINNETTRAEAAEATKQPLLGYTAENVAHKGVANGYASLNGSGIVPSSQLPSYVDEIQEFANFAAFPGTGATGIIYIAQDTNAQYRWTGSAYVELVASPGTTDNVPEGSTNLYFTVARVLAAVLTGISFGTTSAILATDTVLQAFGKLQAQITQLFAQSIPTGGSTNQILIKNSSTNYDTVWANPVATSTGTSISFAKETIYGSIGSPETGNITYNSTPSSVVGTVCQIIHNNGSAPTFDSNFKLLSGSGSYVTSQINHIYCEYLASGYIVYTIQQAT